jgi:hypothetical protein
MDKIVLSMGLMLVCAGSEQGCDLTRHYFVLDLHRVRVRSACS